MSLKKVNVSKSTRQKFTALKKEMLKLKLTH